MNTRKEIIVEALNKITDTYKHSDYGILYIGYCGNDRGYDLVGFESGAIAADIDAALGEKGDGAALIAAERERQIEVEKWTPEHDDEHTGQEMALAAAAYALPEVINYGDESEWHTEREDFFPENWNGWFKPTPDDRIRELVKAGALIAAEIDRLLRKQQSR